jgi:hypothetical protein
MVVVVVVVVEEGGEREAKRRRKSQKEKPKKKIFRARSPRSATRPPFRPSPFLFFRLSSNLPQGE